MEELLKILVVDDDEIDRMAVARALKLAAIQTTIKEVSCAKDALKALSSEKFDCALFDYMLPDSDGLSLLKATRKKQINTPVVMLTGQTDERLVVELLRAGASDYLPKDHLNSDNLGHALQTAIRLHEIENERLQAHLELKAAHQELKNSHEQLLQSEKLASIGQLAAGVAHEINNPVGYVYSNLTTLENYIKDLVQLIDTYAQLENLVTDDTQLVEIRMLKEKLDLDYLKEDIFDLVGESLEGITRVKGIVQDLKDFSHVDEAEWQWADLHKGLNSTLNIVNNEIKYKAEVIKEYGEIPEVECLISQLNQVFMNMLVNAAHAIDNRGMITIRTGLANEQVWISFTDTGMGISSDNLIKIFDPFFTTKAVGTGTGLGLSLSYGIMKKHGGKIKVDSEEGIGTTFTLYIPIKQPKVLADK